MNWNQFFLLRDQKEFKKKLVGSIPYTPANPQLWDFQFSSNLHHGRRFQRQIPSLFVCVFTYIDLNHTLLQWGCFLVGLFGPRWGKCHKKSHIFMRRNRMNLKAHNTQQQDGRMPVSSAAGSAAIHGHPASIPAWLSCDAGYARFFLRKRGWVVYSFFNSF